MRIAAALLFAVLAASLTMSAGPGGVAAAPVSFSPVADAYVSSAAPEASFGSERDLLAGVDSVTEGMYRTFLMFDLPDLEGKVVNARLRLFAPLGIPDGGFAAGARSNWSEDTVTWAVAPAIGDAVTPDGALSGDGWVEVKLDPAGITAPGRLTFAILGSGAVMRLGSRESANAPRLVLQVAASDPQESATPEITEPPSATPSDERPAPSDEPPAPSDEPPAPSDQPPATPSDQPPAPPSDEPPAPPSPTSAPSSGIPVTPEIPDGYGDLFRKDFRDGVLAPFRTLTYPNVHPGDLMIQYGRFVADSAHISVHDGYLDLRATRNLDGLWSQAFVGTGLTGDGSPAAFQFQYGTARAMARMNSGRGAWQSLWYLVADSWGAAEIDWAELINGRLTANLHGTIVGDQQVSLPAFPSNEWHEYGITKAPTYVAFLLDGREVGRANVSMSAPMGLLADAKVGLFAPDASTPSTLFLQVAWWTVDPL
jgi:Glycosyl hydrolases family 16